MVQIYGRKQVKIIAAHELPYIYNHRHCYTEVDMDRIDFERYPMFQKAKVLDVMLCPGEVLFLPVGCWHYVRAVEVSITMSFTNFLFNNDFYSFYHTYEDI
jgi:ribosomal protein L16 Arg81 hydroxylase